MERKGAQLIVPRLTPLVFVFWLVLTQRGMLAQSATAGPSLDEPPPSVSAFPSHDASARMARIEAQLQTLAERNRQLQQQHDDLMTKYHSLLRQCNAPVFGAAANNPDGMGVPGAVRMGAEMWDEAGRQKNGDNRKKEGALPKSSKEKAKEEKKEGKTEAKKPEEEPWYEVGSDGALQMIWRDRRLYLESAHKDFRFRFTGRFNWDTGWLTRNGGLPNLPDGSDMRRARIGFEGYIYENFYFRARYDFASSGSGNDSGVPPPGGAGSASNFRDVFLRVEKLPFLSNFQAGQFKEPIMLIWNSTSNQLTFMERPAVFNTLDPGRNLGVSTFRTFFNDRFYFNTGLYRSATNDGAFSVGTGQWASTTRLAFLPFWEESGRYLVHFGGSYSHRAYNYRDTNNILPAFSTPPDIAIGTPAVLSTGTILSPHNENILAGEFVTVLGPFSIQSEVLAVSIDGVNSSNQSVAPVYWGTYAQVSYFLTGENRRYRRTGPYAFTFTTPNIAENFFTLSGWPHILGRGAWEIAARYDYLNLSGGGLYVPTKSDGSGGTGRWNGLSLALNWWLNSNATIMFDYVHGWRSSDTPGRTGQMDAFAMRFRFFF